MTMDTAPSPRVHLVRHQSDFGRWELASRDPDPRLRGWVLGYLGVDSRIHFFRERHMPSGEIILIVNFGPPLWDLDRSSGVRTAEHRAGFIVGLHDRYALTESTGASHLVFVRFTPIGARRFFGLPNDSLTNRAVALDDVIAPARARALVGRLAEASGWEARFALLESFVAERLADAPPVSEGVAWAWHRLHESGGEIEVGMLAAGLGCSRKHLIARFREEVGLPPKLLGRILRFQRVLRAIEREPSPRWVDVAIDCGYFDQAHLIREFREFSGSTPTDFLERLVPDGGGILG
jgi:AraC-like DNA-binding protein